MCVQDVLKLLINTGKGFLGRILRVFFITDKCVVLNKMVYKALSLYVYLSSSVSPLSPLDYSRLGC